MFFEIGQQDTGNMIAIPKLAELIPHNSPFPFMPGSLFASLTLSQRADLLYRLLTHDVGETLLDPDTERITYRLTGALYHVFPDTTEAGAILRQNPALVYDLAEWAGHARQSEFRYQNPYAPLNTIPDLSRVKFSTARRAAR